MTKTQLICLRHLIAQGGEAAAPVLGWGSTTVNHLRRDGMIRTEIRFKGESQLTWHIATDKGREAAK